MERGWIVVTRLGGKHKATLYAVTWLPIDYCDGKLDVSSTDVAGNEWKVDSGNKIRSTNMGHFSTTVVPIDKNKEVKVA